jgi:hypothetical protein
VLANGLYLAGATSVSAGFALGLLGVLKPNPSIWKAGIVFAGAGLGAALLGYGVDRFPS